MQKKPDESGLLAENMGTMSRSCRDVLQGAAELGIMPILIAANPAADVETDYLKIHDLRELTGTAVSGRWNE